MTKINYMDLIEKATYARVNAYAPYSGYKVGAALLCSDGTVFKGANIENMMNKSKGDLACTILDIADADVKAEIEKIMDEAVIPCGPVLNVKEAIEHPHIQAREMMVHCEHPTAGDLYFQGVVAKLSETPGTVEFASPLLGQHNQEIFGITAEEEAQLKAEGVL